MRVVKSIDEFKKALNYQSEELVQLYNEPVLFDFSQSDRRPFFVSTLLHGNETSGWDAIRSLVSEALESKGIPSFLLLLGNLSAAERNLRHLDGQPDFNRIWDQGNTPYHEWAREVLEFVRSRKPWYSLDIHNNTGPNPHHSIITSLDESTLQSARLFSQNAIFAQQPPGVLTRRCAEFSIALTIEAGLPQDPHSTIRASNFIKKLWDRQDIPSTDLSDLKIFENSVRVVLENAAELTSEDVPHFAPFLHRFNFKKIPAGTKLAKLAKPKTRLLAIDEQQQDRTEDYLSYDGSNISVRQDTIMSMYTEDPLIVRQDCVCYFLNTLDAKSITNSRRAV